MNHNNHNNIEDKSISNIKKGGRKSVQLARGAKQITKMAKLLIPLLKAALPFLLIILIAFLISFLVLLVVFWAAPQGSLYTTTEHTIEDERLLELYEDLSEENNLKERWLVSGESSIDNPWFPKVTEETRGGEHYHSVFERTNRELIDHTGKDKKFFETFGQIHAGNIFYIISHSLSETDDKYKAKVADDFKPYLYYKESSITNCSLTTDEDGNSYCSCSTTDIFLLVEAYTIQGHYIYEYEWQTDTDSDG